jgi:hypothetical protein
MIVASMTGKRGLSTTVTFVTNCERGIETLRNKLLEVICEINHKTSWKQSKCIANEGSCQRPTVERPFTAPDCGEDTDGKTALHGLIVYERIV